MILLRRKIDTKVSYSPIIRLKGEELGRHTRLHGASPKALRVVPNEADLSAWIQVFKVGDLDPSETHSENPPKSLDPSTLDRCNLDKLWPGDQAPVLFVQQLSYKVARSP